MFMKNKKKFKRLQFYQENSSLNMLFYFLIFSLISNILFQTQRSWIQILFAYAFTFSCEFIKLLFLKKTERRRKLVCYINAATTVTGVLLLVHNIFPLFYGFVSSAALLINSLVTKKQKNKEFNSINLAIILGLCFYPLSSFLVINLKIILKTVPFFILFAMGCFQIWLKKVWQIPLVYILSILSYAILSSFYAGENIQYWLGPELGTTGMMFLFIILSSNKLVSKNKIEITLFAFLLAFFKIILKTNEFFYSSQISLFIVSSLWLIFNELKMAQSSFWCIDPSFGTKPSQPKNE